MTSSQPVTYSGIVDGIRDVLPEAVVFPNLGTNTAAFMHRGPRDQEFYMWGAMGTVHSVALGFALSKPDRTVVIVDGDGALLMGLFGLTTIGVLSPRNLVHVAVDNGAWGNTGGQMTHTARGVDLAMVAVGCGYPAAIKVRDILEFRAELETFQAAPRLTFIHVPIEYVSLERPPIEPDPVGIKARFMAAVE